MYMEWDTIANELKSQWEQPKSLLSLLQLVGGDVIETALAQSTGHKINRAVFSFGWVSYAFRALASAFGSNRVLRPPDTPCIVINGLTGYSRTNQSWILSRILRDYEADSNFSWRDANDKARLEDLKAESKEPKKGLSVKILDSTGEIVATKKKSTRQVNSDVRDIENGPSKPGAPPNVDLDLRGGRPSIEPKRDFMFRLALWVIIFQLVISAIPFYHGSWGILLITAFGTALANLHANLPQWRLDLYAARPLWQGKEKTVIITRGNGAQHALVLCSKSNSLDLEDLAGSGEGNPMSREIKGLMAVFVILWMALLITVTAIASEPVDLWLLFLVGAIGMTYNVCAAALPKDPSAFGLNLVPRGEAII